MRAIAHLAPLCLAVLAGLSPTGAPVGLAPSPALAQEAPAAAPVPGPLRPVAAPPVAPAPEPADRRKPRPEAAVPPPVAPPEPVAPAPLPPTVVLEGAFRPGARGEKAAGRAIARLATHDLRLEKLAVTAGRDLEVWLVATDRLGNGEDFGDTKHVSLGKLKKAEGDQSYRFPPELDLRVYRMVVVWSRRERSARAGALLVLQPTVAKSRPAKPRRR